MRLIDRFQGSTFTMYRPDHDDSGKYWFHTEIHNDAIVERNKRMRLEGIVPVGKPLPLRDGEHIRFAFRIHPVEWRFFRRDYPDIVAAYEGKDYDQMISACYKMTLLHPEWNVTEGNW